MIHQKSDSTVKLLKNYNFITMSHLEQLFLNKQKSLLTSISLTKQSFDKKSFDQIYMRSSHQNLCCSSILAPGASAFSNRCGVSRSTRPGADFGAGGMAGRGMGAGGAGARAAGPGRRKVPRMACKACNAGGASGVSGMMGAVPPKAGG